MGGFKLILGTPINAVPQPWFILNVPGVMVNAYDIMRVGLSRVRGRGLRKLLGIDDDTELWIDSGGYQFLKRSMDPGTYKIAKIYREVDADYYISLDYPPGPMDDPSMRARKIAKTISSFMSLKGMLRSLVEEGRLIPVFHISVGESLRLQLRCYEPHSPVAAAGGLIPYFMQRSGRYSRLKAVLFLILLRKLWRGRLHALGLASAAVIPLLRVVGVDSGDTQTWRHKAAFGKIIVPGLGERHISGQRVRFGPAVLRDENEVAVYRSFVDKASKLLNVSHESLVSSFEARALFNAWVLLQVASNGGTYNGASKPFVKLYESARALFRLPPEELEAKLATLLSYQPGTVEMEAGEEVREIATVERLPSSTPGSADMATSIERV
ncbi:hypothetical protein [Pyrodictium occultum]|uniref:hypothetical protein n=1 Tax=Pyrodictium occultum TaxID=2309 RepID=UPI00191C47FC|nr:hypothetical protein [Pyrodictium occultum]